MDQKQNFTKWTNETRINFFLFKKKVQEDVLFLQCTDSSYSLIGFIAPDRKQNDYVTVKQK